MPASRSPLRSVISDRVNRAADSGRLPCPAARARRSSQVRRRLQRGRKNSRSACAAAAHDGCVPRSALVRPGHHLDRLGQLTVTRTRRCCCESVRTMSATCARQLRRSSRPTRSAVHGTARLQRVDREHPYPPRPSRCTHGPRSVSIPTTTYSVSASAIDMLAEQRVQPGHLGQALGQPRLGSVGARLVLDLDVVVVLVPSHHLRTARRAPVSHSDCSCLSARGRTTSGLMNKCSRHSQRARHPISGRSSRPPAGARSLIRTTTPVRSSAHPPALPLESRIG